MSRKLQNQKPKKKKSEISVSLSFPLPPSTVVIKLSAQEFKTLLEHLTTCYYYRPESMLHSKMQFSHAVLQNDRMSTGTVLQTRRTDEDRACGQPSAGGVLSY